jgi:ribosomal protein S12
LPFGKAKIRMVTWRQLTMEKVVRGKKKHKVRAPLLWGCPQKKAVTIRVYNTKPKKPNSCPKESS